MVPSPATQSLLIAESSGSEDNDYDSLYGSGTYVVNLSAPYISSTTISQIPNITSGTDTTSLSSSITKYRYENGRR
jgi:hypothetical protein